MEIRSAMSTVVATAGVGDSLQTAARRMKLRDVGILPVLEEGKLVGVITDRDITVRGTASGRDPDRTRVGQLMSGDVATCWEGDEVESAVAVMADKRVRRLPVLDRYGVLAGMFSLSDLAQVPDGVCQVGEILRVIREVSVPAGFESY
jgi:CBS domain-containing protein